DVGLEQRSPDEHHAADEHADAQRGPERPEHRAAITPLDLLPAKTSPNFPLAESADDVVPGRFVMRLHNGISSWMVLPAMFRFATVSVRENGAARSVPEAGRRSVAVSNRPPVCNRRLAAGGSRGNGAPGRQPESGRASRVPSPAVHGRGGARRPTRKRTTALLQCGVKIDASRRAAPPLA